MSLQVEKLEKNMAKLTVEVPAEQFEKALTTAFNKNKSRFNIPGFRKGKAPQAMVEKMYGVEVLYEDAINEALDATYGDAVTESELDVVSRPEIDVVQVEKGKELIYTATVAVKPEVTAEAFYDLPVEHQGRAVAYLLRLFKMGCHIKERHPLLCIVAQDPAEFFKLRRADEGADILQHHQMVPGNHCL